MCGGGPSLPPQTDPKEERKAAEADATNTANAKIAADRRRKQQQSLLASGADGSTTQAQTSSVLAIGKDKLGT